MIERKRNAHFEVRKSHFIRFKNKIREENFLIKLNQFVEKSAKFQINSGNNKQRTCQSCTNEPYGNFGQSKYMGQIPSNAPPPV